MAKCFYSRIRGNIKIQKFPHFYGMDITHEVFYVRWLRPGPVLMARRDTKLAYFFWSRKLLYWADQDSNL